MWKSKKIIYYTSSLRSGGAERQLVYTAIEAKKNGYDPVIIVDYPGNHFEKVLKEYSIPFYFTNTTGRNPIKRFHKLMKMTRRERPAIFHSFLSTRNLWGMFIAMLCRVPLRVASIRGTNDASFSGVKIYSKFCHYIICNSKLAESITVNKYNVSSNKVRTIYNAIDLSKFNSDISKKKNGKITGIIIASITKNKNHLSLIEALIKINKKEKLEDFEFLLVGKKKDDGIYNSIFEDIKKNKLEDKIKFLGVREDIPEILNNCDFLVVPSFHEGFPNVLMEAMATKTFVIATKVGGIPELISDNSTGFLIPTPSVKDIENIILKYLNANREKINEIVNKAYLRIQEYNWDNIFKEINSIYATGKWE